MGYQPDYRTEAVIYAKHLLANVKDPKIAVLMQNDDYGKDYWEGFKEGMGKEAGRIVKHVTYEVTDPTVDSQVIQMDLRRQRLLQASRSPSSPRSPCARRPRSAGSRCST